jgi:hypothetical protein
MAAMIDFWLTQKKNRYFEEDHPRNIPDKFAFQMVQWFQGKIFVDIIPIRSMLNLHSFIGGGNRSTRRKPPTCRKSLTNFIT